MMIGHIAPALAGKKFAPKTSLGTLIFAGVFLDLLWPVFNLAGIEHFRITPGISKVTPLDLYDFPYSHGLVFSLLWSILFGAVYFALKKNRRAAVILALCVFSHWILDFISHIQDLPIVPGGSVKLGLGLWNSVPGTVIVEYGLFLAGLVVYFRSTKAKNMRGKILPVFFAVFLTLSYAGGFFSPLPSDMKALIIGSLFSQILFIAIGYWTDRNRESRQS
jgi:hypothetical protein